MSDAAMEGSMYLTQWAQNVERRGWGMGECSPVGKARVMVAGDERGFLPGISAEDANVYFWCIILTVFDYAAICVYMSYPFSLLCEGGII